LRLPYIMHLGLGFGFGFLGFVQTASSMVQHYSYA